MHKVLRHDDVVEGMKFIIQSQPIVTRPFFQIDTSEPILAELSSNLAWMQLQTGSIVPILGENPSVTFSTQGKNNERDETRIEITATTPLACTVREAEPILWHYLTNEDTSNSFGFVRVCLKRCIVGWELTLYLGHLEESTTELKRQSHHLQLTLHSASFHP